MTIRKLNKNQFAFDMRHMGRRYRKVLSCSASLINEVYRKWCNEVIANHGIKSYKLTSLLDEYLNCQSTIRISTIYYSSQEKLYVKTLKDHFPSHFNLDEVKRFHIEDLVNKLKKKNLSPSTINKYIGTLGYFYNWCIQREYTHHNPIVKCKLPLQNERVISLTQREVREILNKADGHLKDAIMIALNTGMRRGEILTLKWTQVNFETRFISLEATQTKGKTRRDIPMTDTLYEYLLKPKARESKA